MLYSPTAKRYPRRMFPLLLLAAAAFAAEPVRAPETFTELATGEVGSLDPAFPYDAPSQSVMQNVYETLIAFKGASLSEYEPRLSEKVPSAANGLVTNGGRTYRFPIRKGVKFHDGTEVTPGTSATLLRFMITGRLAASALLEPIAGVPSTRSSTGTVTLDFRAREAVA